MKKKRNVAIVTLMLVVVFALSACGGGSGSGGGALYDDAGGDDYDYNYGYPEAEEGFYSRNEAESLGSTIPEDRKIIRNATLEIMTQDVAALYRNIVEYGATIGGYEHSYSISNYEAYSVINAVFKVPPEKLGEFVNFVGESGDVINSSMGSEDITESYFDVATRLETKRKSLEQYYQLLKSAHGIEEIVYIQRTIDGITEDIESLEGRMKVWNSQVNMATVNIYIRQDNDPRQIRKEISWNTLSTDDMGYLIKLSFYSVTNTIMSIVQWLIVILVGYSPVWIVIGVGVFLWIKLGKKELPGFLKRRK